MAQACPLANRRIDGTVVRINAAFVATTLWIYMASSQPFWLYLLGADFIVRLYLSPRFSPLWRLSVQVQNALRLRPNPTDAGAKRLAAQFGLLFTALLIVAHHGAWGAFSTGTALLLIGCAMLEALFNCCVGCRVYDLARRLFPEAA